MEKESTPRKPEVSVATVEATLALRSQQHSPAKVWSRRRSFRTLIQLRTLPRALKDSFLKSFRMSNLSAIMSL